MAKNNSRKDVQATGEAFSSEKGISSTSRDEIYRLFYFWAIFADTDPDTDQGTPLNPDPQN
jgi:hypothetical protein